jgi:hypothetical protein
VVGVASGVEEDVGDRPQEPVAGLVAELVVDGPEVVEGEHDQAERATLADPLDEELLKGPVVEQAGQVVGPGPDATARWISALFMIETWP